MIRVEIIANHSVEDNILDALAENNAGKYYTKYPSILGVGTSGPRMGDATWPEENFGIVIWCEPLEALAAKQAVKQVKEQFPDEGIKIFCLPEVHEKQPADAPPNPAGVSDAQAHPVDAPHVDSTAETP